LRRVVLGVSPAARREHGGQVTGSRESPAASGTGEDGDSVSAETPHSGSHRMGRWLPWLIVAIAALVLAVVVAIFTRGGEAPADTEETPPATEAPAETTEPTIEPTTEPSAEPPSEADDPPAEPDMPLSAPGEHIPDSNVSAIPSSSDPAVPLTDGDYFGHLASVDVTAGTVDVDIEIFYIGQAAIDYLTANDPTAENPPPNDYIIVNESTQLRTLTLADDVRVWDWCNATSGGTLGFAERDVAEWAAATAGGEMACDAGAALSRGWNEVYWFQVRDAEVEQVIGQYLP
jgi:hypothetical protein